MITRTSKVASLAAVAIIVLTLFNTGSASAADARPCNSADKPAQIRLVLPPGAVICYGGTVGTVRVDEIHATGFASGGYTVCVASYSTSVCRKPNQFARLDRKVTLVEIKPGDWPA